MLHYLTINLWLLQILSYSEILSFRKSATDCRPRWRHKQKCFVSSHNHRKDNNQSKNKEQTELPEKHLHGSPTTKELKKHSSRLVGGAETGSRGREDMLQGKVVNNAGDSTFMCRNVLGGTMREWDRSWNPGFQCEQLKNQNSPL